MGMGLKTSKTGTGEVYISGRFLCQMEYKLFPDRPASMETAQGAADEEPFIGVILLLNQDGETSQLSKAIKSGEEISLRLADQQEVPVHLVQDYVQSAIFDVLKA